MIRALCAKSLRDAKWLLLALGAVMFFLPWLNIWVSSKISVPALTEFLANALPKKWERITGTSFDVLATLAGRIAIVYVHPLILFGSAAWAIARGSDCVAGEIGRGTMEMLLAQPVRRVSIYATQALMTILGSALLASATWLGIATGLATVELAEPISAALFIPPTLNQFSLLVCVGGMAAFVSSWESQRWRAAGLMTGFFVLSMFISVASRISDGWEWLNHFSFLSNYKPESMANDSAEAWSLLAYHDDAVVGLGLASHSLLLLGLGILCYVAGAIIFSRREIPAPL